MILKLIIFAIIALLVYKVLGGKLPSLGGRKDGKLSDRDEKKKIEEDTLIECDKCSTFVTYKESIIVKSKVYCSKECAGF